jgi:hypothetical protein
MTIEKAELDQMQSDYKAAVDEWVTAIRHEEALASSNHSVAEIDQWSFQKVKGRSVGTQPSPL